MYNQIIEWLSRLDWKEILYAIGSVVAIVLGIFKMKEKLKIRPNLQIPEENIEMEVREEHGQQRLKVRFKLYNKKTWWNRFFISKAFSFVFKGTLVSEDGKTLALQNNPETLILYPCNYIKPKPFNFPYQEDIEELIIQVESTEPKKTLVKYLKISEYLTRDES